MGDMLWTTAGNEDNARQTINTRIDQSLFTWCMVPCRRKRFLPAVSVYLYKNPFSFPAFLSKLTASKNSPAGAVLFPVVCYGSMVAS